jgi:3-isopropylmalate/(R)-2-methylmalate dehydratase small subunit
MTPFTVLDGVAAPLDVDNVDTDMIIPKQFLKTIKRSGLGKNLFDEMRYRKDGSEIETFVLNKAPYRQAKVLVSGKNFGCGSSREHAPWALLDFGIRCVVAESYADIFYNNCFKNGILPVVLPAEECAYLRRRADGETAFRVDLEAQEIRVPEGSGGEARVLGFDVDPFSKTCLLKGLDDIARTLEKEPEISAFEARDRAARPWLYANA